MCSASAPTASPAATAATPTSAPGSSRRATGFTLVELLVVVALIAVAVAVASLSLRDPALTQLEREGERLAMLLEAARAEARASGVPARWEPSAGSDADAGDFRFVGLPPSAGLPQHWLGDRVAVEIVGARAVVLGPEPVIGAQRIVLGSGEQRVVVATDGLAPFSAEVVSATQ